MRKEERSQALWMGWRRKRVSGKMGRDGEMEMMGMEHWDSRWSGCQAG